MLDGVGCRARVSGPWTLAGNTWMLLSALRDSAGSCRRDGRAETTDTQTRREALICLRGLVSVRVCKHS